MIKQILRYYHTLRYLRPKQIFFQLFYRLKRATIKRFKISFHPTAKQKGKLINLNSFISKNLSYQSDNFTFLNLSKQFRKKSIDWNFNQYGKLWLINIHYFDFLHQSDMDQEVGTTLIKDYINSLTSGNVVLEPYPTSLRGINWIKFIYKYSIDDDLIDNSLYAQYQYLANNVEYHILGNHILENAFSLLFGSFYFQNYDWFNKSNKLLQEQLHEQILSDGAHFELSPMYHKLVLDRLLDCINLLKNNSRFKSQEKLEKLCIHKGRLMLSWLNNMTFPDGSNPHFNDSTNGITPTSKQLFQYADELGIKYNKTLSNNLFDSGYRKFENKKYSCIIDIGSIGPDYIPGHGHADTLGFVLFANGKQIVVNTGVSTYEKNLIRHQERSTVAHNTVVVNGINSSDVWSSFRVGDRCKVSFFCNNKIVKASHNGYEKLNVSVLRKWKFTDESIIIEDVLEGDSYIAIAYIHFDHKLDVKLNNNIVTFGKESISIDGADKLNIITYNQALGFNKTIHAPCLTAVFNSHLITKFYC